MLNKGKIIIHRVDSKISAVAGVLSGDLSDTAGGATHYHTMAIAPSWATGH